MTLKQMEYFLRVAEAGGFARAASLLDIGQPSLSRQVRLLEVELRQTLFYRTGRGVTLTEAGKRFVEHCRAVLESVARARSDLVEHAQNPTGRVVIGLPPRVSRFLSAPLVQTFRANFPRATISIAEGLTASLYEWLLIGRVDLALLYNPLPSPQLDMEPLLTEELVLIGRAAGMPALPKAVKFSRLSKYPLILPQMPNAARALIESICRKTRTKLDISVEVDTVQAIMELVALNQGYGILPRSVASAAQARHKLEFARIHTPTLRDTLVLASSRHRPFTKLAEEASSLIRGFDFPGLIRRNVATLHP